MIAKLIQALMLVFILGTLGYLLLLLWTETAINQNEEAALLRLRDMASGKIACEPATDSGYVVSVRSTSGGCSATAAPEKQGKTGYCSFLLTPEGNLRIDGHSSVGDANLLTIENTQLLDEKHQLRSEGK